MGILQINIPLIPCSPALCFLVPFIFGRQIRYVHGILHRLLGKSAAWLHEVIPYCFALHYLFKLQIYFSSVVSCPVAYGLVQGTLEPFILPVIFALILIIGIALYYCPVQILQRAIPIATSCRAMFAGKGIGHVCVAAGEMWGVHGW